MLSRKGTQQVGGHENAIHGSMVKNDTLFEYLTALNVARGYEDVGFRVIQALNGKELEQKVGLATLGAPVVSAASTTPDSITLS